ncbi:MAG TPA: phosphotransferase [Acidimicrobiales bacterium]
MEGWREPAVQQWCVGNLGAAPVRCLFETGHLSRVIGLELADLRRVVVKIRPNAPRLAACAAVQRYLHGGGFPCPEPLAGPSSWPDGDDLAASAEAFVPGGRRLRRDEPDAVVRYVRLFRRLIVGAENDDALDLEPALPWVGWGHGGNGIWPVPDEGSSLEASPGPAWLDDLAMRVRERMADAPAARLPAIVGHADFMAQNIRWDEKGTPLVVDDWDSVARLPEAALAGAAAVAWPGDGSPTASTVDETRAFLDAYERLRGEPFTDVEHEVAWAAGLWMFAFDAKKHLVANDGVTWLLEKLQAELDVRSANAGLG